MSVMRMIDLIETKRNGKKLTQAEIHWMIDEYTAGNIPDYQMSAMLMAIYFQGMSSEELGELTLSMSRSGEQISFADLPGKTVDKHSTGGVGDTTSLIIAPLVASVGVNMPKMSGRGLGHTGGTIDKLESIPGFHTSISEERFKSIISETHVAIAGQTANLAPADKKIYALRDVTGTVESIPLIASSIMSKKLASGADIIMLDVKTGSGAFMKKAEDAVKLADAMIQIGKHAGKKTLALISDMSQPLGYAVGNILEVKEAIACLENNGPEDLTSLSLAFASHLVFAAGKTQTLSEAEQLVTENLANGKALAAFKNMVAAQGGDTNYISHPEKFAQAEKTIEVVAPTSGYISELDALQVGKVSHLMGAGRDSLDDEIDLTAGVLLHKKIGDKVAQGEQIATLYTNYHDEERLQTAITDIQKAVKISGNPQEAPQLIHKIIQ